MIGKGQTGLNIRALRKSITILAAAALVCVLARDTVGIGAGAPRAHATFLGTNGKIAFESDRDGDFDIYVMNWDGSGVVNLTPTSPGTDQVPVWSPTGTRIAFTSPRNGNREIHTMTAYGDSPTNLTLNPSADSEAAWKSSGLLLAFSTDRIGSTHEIFAMNAADGSGQVNLTNHIAHDTEPAGSPAGDRIAFQTNRDGNDEIYVMDWSGNALANLSRSPASSDTDPSWSPDGSKIAFVSDRSGDLEIYVMDADGENQTRITFSAGLDYRPAWSPDGTKIAFHTDRDGNVEIYVMNADGSSPTNVTNNPAEDASPDWQPLVDTDGDGCTDYQEVGPNQMLGGQRNPLDFWDFFDVTGDQAIDLSDTLDILSYFGDAGTSPAGDLRDRDNFGAAQPWQTYESNTGVDLTDALVNLASFGHDCSGPP